MNTRKYEHYQRLERRLDEVVFATVAHALPLRFAAGQRPAKVADRLAFEFIWDVLDALEIVRGWFRIRRSGTCHREISHNFALVVLLHAVDELGQRLHARQHVLPTRSVSLANAHQNVVYITLFH